MQKFDPKQMARLDNPERRGMFDADAFLKQAGLLPGMTTADIGCGTGFFTFAASRIAGENGLVYALDVQPEMLEELRRRIDDSGAQNIRALLTEEDDLPLPDACIQIAWMAFVLHEVEDPLPFLKEAGRILIDGGRICILEWKKVKTGKGPALDVRLSEREAEELLQRGGFGEITITDFNSMAYLAIGKKIGSKI